MSDEKELVITDDTVKDYIKSFMPTGSLTQGEVMQFIQIAKAYQLNPFKREIYCIPYGQGANRKLSILTGYEVYLKRAERLKTLDGWNVTTEGSIKDGSLKAIITIHRKDWKHPFVHEVLFSEYVQRSPIWQSKPITMIRKVAVSQGFRLCFSDELGGMPYSAEELPENMTEHKQEKNVTPEQPEIVADLKEALNKNAELDDLKAQIYILVSEPGVVKKMTEKQLESISEIRSGKEQSASQLRRIITMLQKYKSPVEVGYTEEGETFNPSIPENKPDLPEGVL